MNLNEFVRDVHKICDGIEKHSEVWQVQVSPDKKCVVGPARMLRRVLGLYDVEYGWPREVHLDDAYTSEQLVPGHRHHPFLCRNGVCVAVVVSLSEYEDILKLRQNAQTTAKGNSAQPINNTVPMSKDGVVVNEQNVPVVWNSGDVILDLYEVKEIHTSGGMGLVYKVHHKGWNVDLAVKSPRSDFFQTEQQKQNFIRECETWINLGLHPHIVSCHYVRNLGGIPRVFAEYAEGGNLKEWIETRKLYEGGKEEAIGNPRNRARLVPRISSGQFAGRL